MEQISWNCYYIENNNIIPNVTDSWTKDGSRWGPAGGVLSVPRVNNKLFHVSISKGPCMAGGISTQVMSFIVILSASKSLFQCLVACRNIALTGSHRCFLLHLSVYNMYRKEVFRISFSVSMQESSVSCQVSSPGWCMSTRIHLGTIPRNAQCTCRVITLTSVWLPSFLLFQTILDWMPNRGISRNSGTGAVALRAQRCTTTIRETI